MTRPRVEVVLDCRDPHALAPFWEAALRYRRHPDADGEPYLALLAPDHAGPPLVLQRVPEPKVRKNRVHLDLYSRDVDADGARLEALGARRVGEPQDWHGQRFQVYADPEGNEFCLLVEWLPEPFSFAALLDRLAAAWSTGDAPGAADCFTDDAVYVEPPDRQRYTGRDELVALSTSTEPMTMTWHHVVYDERAGIGCGEYTFTIGGRRYHGVAMIQVRDGRISRWREYQVRDDARDWPAFAGDSQFS